VQVLFFVDYDSLAAIKEQFAIYADKFDPFALESNAMSQYLGRFPCHLER
jgi:predicted oxidoreductase (fatty acid repression mutant protein)